VLNPKLRALNQCRQILNLAFIEEKIKAKYLYVAKE
jgi:hypothetical protein